MLELTTAEWDRVMGVNLRGAFVTLRECGRAMREHGGAIVAVTSVSGFLSERMMAHYSVSKAGLAALVKIAARELGPLGIRVNAVAPGATDTPMFAATQRLPGYRERVSAPRRARPARKRRRRRGGHRRAVPARLGHGPDRRRRRRRCRWAARIDPAESFEARQ